MHICALSALLLKFKEDITIGAFEREQVSPSEKDAILNGFSSRIQKNEFPYHELSNPFILIHSEALKIFFS